MKVKRRGASAILVLFMSLGMLVFSGFCIGICQIQLAQSETQMVADCCSISAATILGEETFDEFDTPKKLAIFVAEQNSIFFNRAKLKSSDIILGSSRMNSLTGKMDFIPGGRPRNAVRVNVGLGAGGSMASQKLLFPFLGETDSFAVGNHAITAKLEHDICLVFDRSQSMCHHKNFGERRPHHPAYPPPYKPKASKFFPHPSNSRWAAAVKSVIPLSNALEETPMNERLSIVTFACDRQFSFGGRKIDVKAATSDVEPTIDYARCHETLEGMFDDIPMVNGQTWIHSGINLGADSLFGSGSRPHAFKTMIILTDGAQFVKGDRNNRDHYRAAEAASKRGITIHTVTYGSNSGFRQMQQIAEIGGGEAYFAPDEETLLKIFSSIGSAPPVSLID